MSRNCQLLNQAPKFDSRPHLISVAGQLHQAHHYGQWWETTPPRPIACFMCERDSIQWYPGLLTLNSHVVPQVLPTVTELLNRRYSQLLVDHFGNHFIRYLKPQYDTNLSHVIFMLIVDPQLLRVLCPVGQTNQCMAGADGQVRTAQVEVECHIYT